MVVRSTLTSLFFKEKEMILLSEDGVIRECALYSRVSTEEQKSEILAEINNIQPKIKELRKYDKYCKEIKKQSRIYTK